MQFYFLKKVIMPNAVCKMNEIKNILSLSYHNVKRFDISNNNKTYSQRTEKKGKGTETPNGDLCSDHFEFPEFHLTGVKPGKIIEKETPSVRRYEIGRKLVDVSFKNISFGKQSVSVEDPDGGRGNEYIASPVYALLVFSGKEMNRGRIREFGR